MGVSDRPDDEHGLGAESADAAPMATVDLRPRTSPAGTTVGRARRRRAWLPMAVLAFVLVAGAVILFQGLSNATVYFCNANEVGKKAECSGAKRFRLQGTVDTGSVQRANGEVQAFTVSYGGTTIPVRYQGDPAGIFREGIPVVIEGRMLAGGTFQGDRILVKHTEQYRQQHPDNVKDYQG